ncbi:MAG: DUF2586 family protein [Sphingobacteriales bacterium]|nr:MAG: DUF2586 family protein [Sphingobacteriales bacterium]
MALNDISFVKGAGGLGRALPGEDHYSGMLFFNSTYPSGFSASAQVKAITSLAAAEALGITNDFSDETKAAAAITLTAVGSNGDTITISIAEPLPAGGTKSVVVATYAKTSADTTPALLATSIAAAINGNTTAGYTASAAAAVVTITARPGLGIYLNTATTPLSITFTGTMAGNISTLFGSAVLPGVLGVASKKAPMHYHISEFFRVAPQGILYVGIFPGPPTTYAELATMQNYAEGKIRQFGVYRDTTYTVGELTSIQAVCAALDAEHKPVSSVLYAADMKAVTDLTTLSSLATRADSKCSVVISQDGGGRGAMLYHATGKSITNLGAALGAVALAKVSESIAWINKFNISSGIECETLAFANGKQYSTVDSNTLNVLNNYRYMFLRKFVGISGSYFNDSHTAVTPASDYAYVENNRTIDKAIRGVYATLLPDLNGPLVMNNDGTLNDNTIAALQADARPNLDQMVRDGEISAYAVTIDPAQNVLSTSKLVIAIKLVGVGVARNITVNIGYTISL